MKGNLKTHLINLHALSPINTFLTWSSQPKQKNMTGCQARRHLSDLPPLTPSLRANPAWWLPRAGDGHEAHGPGFPRNYNREWQVAAKLGGKGAQRKRLNWVCGRTYLAVRIKCDKCQTSSPQHGDSAIIIPSTRLCQAWAQNFPCVAFQSLKG